MGDWGDFGGPHPFLVVVGGGGWSPLSPSPPYDWVGGGAPARILVYILRSLHYIFAKSYPMAVVVVCIKCRVVVVAVVVCSVADS